MNKLNILMAAAELNPIAKAGGLGDVVGSLPKELVKMGCDVRIVLPFYGFIDQEKYTVEKICKASIIFEGKDESFDLFKTFLPNTEIEVLLIKHDFFDSNDIYAGSRINLENKYTRGANDLKRFSFFSHAALEAVKAYGWQPQVIHCHDWHTAVIPDYLKSCYAGDEFFSGVKTLYTIHNLANQGIAPKDFVEKIELDSKLQNIEKDLENGDFNFMVQGILSADIVNTVSPTYANEILTHYQGAGLENILKLRKKALYGIVNGIDVDVFNPAIDPFIASNYDFSCLKKKQENKKALQAISALPQIDVPVIGLVSRFVWQKGIELITDKFADLPCQFIFLGTGQKELEERLAGLAAKHPDKFSANIKFDAKFAQMIYAGSDIFLMPSRFEPCGLGQMIAMRYGTVPVVRKTGGLADTVNEKVGFSFEKYESDELYAALSLAIDTFSKDKNGWKTLQENGMKTDFSWEKSAKEYIKIYKKLSKVKQKAELSTLTK